ncbi:putative Sulfatase N-terminal domain-containing protein [Seiridium cardinale]
MRQIYHSCLSLMLVGLSLAAQPNIVIIFPDDQDLHLGSTEYQPILQREFMAKGTAFTNHYCTVAQCCPSRASLLRGQAAHNTNITYVSSPGGNYDKWRTAAENDNYLAHWLVEAGYNAEYLGKFMNGYNIHNYATAPKGWTHVDALVDPYTYKYNNVVMSADGETPIAYQGYHQTDVIRAKALDRLDYLTSQDKPFYLTIAPTSPHFSTEVGIPVPLARHSGDYNDSVTPRAPNFNPDDEFTIQKPSYLKTMPKLNATNIAFGDTFYRARIQCLQGIDEIINDVVAKLEEKGVLDNTYLIYTSDNGYHIGTHRMPGGKALPYREDTNLPFYVRGPGIPANVTSSAPSAHLDLAPTFLELAGLDKTQWPAFLDGRSLVSTWHNPLNQSCSAIDDVREIINVEFWGIQAVENIGADTYTNNSYKTLRIVGEETSYLYSRWCTNDTELYDTKADPYELTNLALNPDTETARLMTRLNAILLATKSCADVTCRNPWRLLQPSYRAQIAPLSALEIRSLDQAMDAQYDEFFAGIPQVTFQECLEFQSRANEGPYWPENATLGMEYRQPTDNYVSTSDDATNLVAGNVVLQGTWAQRNATWADIMQSARNLTALELI